MKSALSFHSQPKVNMFQTMEVDLKPTLGFDVNLFIFVHFRQKIKMFPTLEVDIRQVFALIHHSKQNSVESAYLMHYFLIF